MKALEPIDYETALGMGLRALGRREYSVRALCDSLRRRRVEDGIIGQVIESLVARGLLNDASSAEEVVERAARRGYSRRRAAMYLRERGYEREASDGALSAWTEDRELELALKALRKTYPEPANDDKRKAYGLLARRGFGFDQISKALGRHFGADDVL